MNRDINSKSTKITSLILSLVLLVGCQLPPTGAIWHPTKRTSTIEKTVPSSQPVQPILSDLQIGDYCIWDRQLITRIWCDNQGVNDRLRRYVNVCDPKSTWDVDDNCNDSIMCCT